MAKAPQNSILIVEDDPGLQSQMRWCFDDNYSVSLADDATGALAAIRRDQPIVVTLDLGLPPDPGGTSVGFELLSEIMAIAPRTKVIVITGREETEHAVRAIGMGAYDFYHKPVAADTLRFVVDRALRLFELEVENERLQRQRPDSPLNGVIASADNMLALCRNVEKIAPTDVSVLILGETGTGKEVFANAVHDLSRRAGKPFDAINCAAIPENLLESELFGHEKGAFTGATAQKLGKIEHANGGTLFLDEIGDMPLPLQAKILRFLQERCIERVGGRESIAVDVRVICATHRNVAEMIKEKTFREDLYYRISEVSITLPPVRDREGDILLLANALLRRFADAHNRGPLSYTNEAIAALESWAWPGNVREMENRVKRAAIMSEGTQVTPEDLELEIRDTDSVIPFNLREVRERAERQAVLRALSSSDNNVAHAARHLGVTRPTLYNLMSKFGITV